jgi:hypothetical protein
MLRITIISDAPDQLRLQLEGRLVANWVDELLVACGEPGLLPGVPGGRAIELDVAGLSFADDRGIAVLRSLLSRRGQLQNCSPFISELLRDPIHAPPESCP